MLHERDLLNRCIIKTDEQGKAEMERVKIYDAAADGNRGQIKNYKQEVNLALKRAEELERLREKAGQELANVGYK